MIKRTVSSFSLSVFTLLLLLALNVQVPILNDISVEKSSYGRDEVVNVSYSKLELSECNCDSPDLEIYRWRDGWEKLRTSAIYNTYCLDGRKMGGLMCDMPNASLVPALRIPTSRGARNI